MQTGIPTNHQQPYDLAGSGGSCFAMGAGRCAHGILSLSLSAWLRRCEKVDGAMVRAIFSALQAG